MRAALNDARAFVQQGYDLELAVQLSCPGAWWSYVDVVHIALVNCISLPLPLPAPGSWCMVDPQRRERSTRLQIQCVDS